VKLVQNKPSAKRLNLTRYFWNEAAKGAGRGLENICGTLRWSRRAGNGSAGAPEIAAHLNGKSSNYNDRHVVFKCVVAA